MRTFISFLLLCFSFVLKAQVPTPDHVVIVIFENRSYFNIIEDPNFVPPYINSLAKDPNYGALFTQSYGLAHPSQPNYLHLFSGSSQGVKGNETPTAVPFTSPNLGASLAQAGRTFVGYAEDLPTVSSIVDSTMSTNPRTKGLALYVRKHCPWVNWQKAPTNGIDPSLSQPFSSFPSDYSTLPTISFVIPNQEHNMHNLGRTVADNWLRSNLSGYAQWAKTNNSLLIITFDEDDSSTGNNNRIATIFFGPMVKPGLYSEPPTGITHHHVLRTLEDMYGLPHSGNAANVTAIKDCWLPVFPNTVLTFQASKETGGVRLSWSTASNINNEVFVIENSRDGIGFQRVDTVMTSGVNQSEQSYSYLHKNPTVGKSFYRIKRTDDDGKISFSKIISVEF